MPDRSAPPPTEPISVDSPAFHRAVDDLLRAERDERACVLLTAGTVEERQEAVAAIGRHTGLHLHQHDLSTLIDEAPMHTQGNLREVFDNTLDGPTLLYFDGADALFAAVARQEREEHLDDDALTPLDYFFERVGAFDGVVVLSLSDPAHVARARTFGPTLVVA